MNGVIRIAREALRKRAAEESREERLRKGDERTRVRLQSHVDETLSELERAGFKLDGDAIRTQSGLFVARVWVEYHEWEGDRLYRGYSIFWHFWKWRHRPRSRWTRSIKKFNKLFGEEISEYM